LATTSLLGGQAELDAAATAHFLSPAEADYVAAAGSNGVPTHIHRGPRAAQGNLNAHITDKLDEMIRLLRGAGDDYRVMSYRVGLTLYNALLLLQLATHYEHNFHVCSP
jgi:hypothetical protein